MLNSRLKYKALAASVLLLSCLVAPAKNKKKVLLPADVLQAHTVLVIVDPQAGVTLEDPTGNRIAREDVEKALMQWGRFSLVQESETADLVITVSKGTGKMVSPEIGGVPANNRPVVIQPTGSGGRIGAQQGNPGYPGDPSNSQSPVTPPHPETEIGQSQDMFVVYRGNKDDPHAVPLNTPSVWRYAATDALHSPDVPAVDQFRKAIEESEKQLAAKP
jgi:hypothetical protein